MSTPAEKEKIREILSRDEFKHSLSYGLRFLNAVRRHPALRLTVTDGTATDEQDCDNTHLSIYCWNKDTHLSVLRCRSSGLYGHSKNPKTGLSRGKTRWNDVSTSQTYSLLLTD